MIEPDSADLIMWWAFASFAVIGFVGNTWRNICIHYGWNPIRPARRMLAKLIAGDS